MSILTSDGERKSSRLIRAAIQRSNIFSVLLYFASFLVFAYFIQNADKTYFSDNSLSPGLATREYSASQTTQKYLKELESLTVDNDRIPVDYLAAKFEEFGLEFYEQEFSLNYPFDQSRHGGKNVYAIFRAPRASSTEAIVLSTPFRNMRHRHGTTLPSVAILLSLAEFFSTRDYWAKDLIFLIGSHELVGMKAWLNAYHGIRETPFLQHSQLTGQSGVIQAALNLEITSLAARSIELKVVGLNGQTPNLDLFNVAVELCQRESIPATFNGQSFSYSANEFKNFKRSLTSTTAMMFKQASGLPTGAHGLFQRFAISSLTFETLPSKQKTSSNSAPNIGRVLEGVLRSLNNMQQRFHRSFFFYLLPSTRRYVSIGLYMIPFALAALPLPLRALNYYFKFLDSSIPSEASNGVSIWGAYDSLFAAQLYGIVTLSIPVLFSRWQICELLGVQQFSNAELMLASFGAIALVGILFKNPMVELNKPASQLHLQSMILLIHIALLVSCLAVLNFSAGFFVTILYVPVLFLVQALQNYNHRTSVKLLQKFLILFVHPLSVHFLCLLVYSIIDLDKTSNKSFLDLSKQHLSRAASAQWRSTLYYIEDWFLYENWTFAAVALGLVPCWMQIWYNSCCSSSSCSTNKQTK